MDKEQTDSQDSWANRLKRALIPALGTIFLGVIGSAAWELVAKPGVGRLSGVAYSLFTFGSKKIQDAAYHSAALNPLPLGDLFVLMLLSCLSAGLAGTATGWMAGRRRFKKHAGSQMRSKLRRTESSKAGGAAEERKVSQGFENLLRASGRRIDVFLVIVSSASAVFSLMIVLTVNQAVLVWRTFQANMTICAPVLDLGEEEALRAKFAQMKGKQDFERIQSQLREIALKNNIELVDSGLD